MIVKSNGENYEIAQAGNHIARCVSVVDLGTQKTEFQGKIKMGRKVKISWELPELKKVFQEDQGEKPFLVSKEYTASLHEKANLTKDLESWRGKAFSEEEKRGFDLKNLLGKPCLLNIVHETKTNGTYANIAAVTQVPKSTKVPDQFNPSTHFDLDEFSSEVFSKLPEFIQTKIKKSPEYAQVSGGEHSQDFGEEVPF